MIKTSLKKQLLFLISSTIAGIGVILACSGSWYTINDTTNYTPELFVDKSYSPFFYSYDYYYDIGHDEKQNDRFNTTVSNDWYIYLDKKYPQLEIEYLLFKSYPKTIDSIIKNNIPSRFANLLTIKSKDKKVKDFLNYLNLAKQAETFALTNSDDWNYDDKPKKVRASSTAFCASVLLAFNASKDKFIKQRYLFQLVRAYYFNNNYNNCVSVFETNQATFDKNTMYYRTMSYVAGALKKTGKLSQANYYYSLVYDGCNELKTTAHYSFKPQNEADWQQTIALCKTYDEKCTLWQMLGVFYNDEQRSLEEILKLNVKSDKCDLLICRAINKLENSLFESGMTSEINSSNATKSQVTNYINILQTPLINDRSLMMPGTKFKTYQWQMALGYLQTLSGNYSIAEINYNAAQKSTEASLMLDETSKKLISSNIRILKIINSISELKTIDKTAEDKLLPELEWLVTLTKQENKELRNNASYTWMKKTLAKKYHAQKDYLKAEYYEIDYAFYSNEKQLHDMQNQLLKTNKTSYEKYCESIYQFNIYILFEYEAIGKTYKDDLDGAIALMEKAGKNGETTLLSNPFNGGIQDCHDCDHALPQKTKYSKISTLKKMKEMKDKLSTDTYNNALLLGNIYYNITFFGSSRMFYYCAIVDASSSNIIDMALAKKYYKMALDAAKTDEQKAKCTYMLSKCERNEWYNNSGNKNVDFIAFKNFTELKKYSNTKYYKDVINECGYFKKYCGK